MSYDYGRKRISKAIGLTGVEAGHISRALKKQHLDPDAYDWEGALSDATDYGDRFEAVKQKLKDQYGLSLNTRDTAADVNEWEGRQNDMMVSDLMNIFERRSPRSKAIDLNRNAKQTFDPSDEIGVRKWKKHPNRYDIKGIDDIFEL